MTSSPEPSITACKGRIHSIESFGTVDGPGIRLVIFFKGCPMRCLYCHNPDTWEIGQPYTLLSADEILAQYRKNEVFYEKGGITATGGEPLLQLDFLIDLFEKGHKEKIHTCLDTSGITFHKDHSDKYDRLLAATDLVLLDIKHVDDAIHQKLTGHSNKPVFDFLAYLDQKGKKVIIRHVVVPGWTDDSHYLRLLGQKIAHYRCVMGIDVLGYHTMGVEKYRQLGIDYPLPDAKDLSNEERQKARQCILQGFRSYRLNKKTSLL